MIPKIKDEFFLRFGLYFLGGFLIIQNKLNIGELLLFAIYFETFAGAVKNISSLDADLRSRQTLTDRVLAALDKAEGVRVKAGRRMNTVHTMQLENIGFRYGEQPVLSDVNLKLEQGDILGITGRSGSGKTTLLKIITGMLKVDEGAVLFDGTDISEIDLQSLYGCMGIVSQEVKLFHATMKENICMGDDAVEAQCMEACRKANIDTFVESLPNGLQTVIGEEGADLSGGQRQRLALARMFYQNPDIIILDEATSALDKKSEAHVYESLKNLKDKIIILVDHRGVLMEMCNKKVHV